MRRFLNHSAVWLLVPAAAITHLWRQLFLSSAPSLLPVTYKTGRVQRGRPWWQAGRERRGISNPVALRGGHEPSERGTT